MINIKGNEVEVTGFTFESKNYDLVKSPEFKLVIREELGLSLPLVNLTFGSDTTLINESINNTNLFKVRINDDEWEFNTAKVSVYNGVYNVQAILNNLEFINDSYQLAEEGTSVDILDKLKYVKLESSISSDDSQIWINPNKSSREFAQSVLNHSYIDGNDFLIYHMVNGDTLEVSSYKSVIEKEPKWKFGTRSSSQYRLESINFETISVNQYQTLVSRTGIETAPAYNNNYNSNYKSDKSSMVLIDAGNCHKNYYSGSIHNINMYAKLYEKLYNGTIPAYIGIKPFDTLVVNQSKDTDFDKDTTLVSNNMIVTRVDTEATNTYISQRFFFSRINDFK